MLSVSFRWFCSESRATSPKPQVVFALLTAGGRKPHPPAAAEACSGWGAAQDLQAPGAASQGRSCRPSPGRPARCGAATLPMTTRGQTWHFVSLPGSGLGCDGHQRMPDDRGHTRRPGATSAPRPGPPWQPLPTVHTAAAWVVMSLTLRRAPGQGQASHSRCLPMPTSQGAKHGRPPSLGSWTQATRLVLSKYTCCVLLQVHVLPHTLGARNPRGIRAHARHEHKLCQHGLAPRRGCHGPRGARQVV